MKRGRDESVTLEEQMNFVTHAFECQRTALGLIEYENKMKQNEKILAELKKEEADILEQINSVKKYSQKLELELQTQALGSERLDDRPQIVEKIKFIQFLSVL